MVSWDFLKFLLYYCKSLLIKAFRLSSAKLIYENGLQIIDNHFFRIYVNYQFIKYEYIVSRNGLQSYFFQKLKK